MPRKPWSAAEDATLRALYPYRTAGYVAAALGRTPSAIYQRARTLELNKSAAFLSSEQSGRLQPDDSRGSNTRFTQGQVPWNAGLKGWKAGGRSAQTRFQKGQVSGRAAQLLQPIGSERITDDGIRQRKIRDDGPPQRRWKSVHSLIWEEAKGPIPAGHVVVFRDRNRNNLQLENLELITRAENCRRNSIHRYPQELKAGIRLLARLKRTIKEKEHEDAR